MPIYFYLLQLLFLLVLFLVALYYVNNKWIRLFILFLSSIFINLQIASIYLGNSFIDYKFYNHFSSDIVLSSIGFFWLETVVFITLILVTYFVLSWSSTKLKSVKLINYKFALVLSLISLLALNISGGVFRNLYDLIYLLNAPEKDFKNSLNALGIDDATYVRPENVKAIPGKNIIVISLESLEKSFLNDKHSSLTPNLRKLSTEYLFYNMPQDPGSGWTSGSIYTMLTGVPSYFMSDGNNVFQKSLDVKLTGVSHVLDNAGYELRYIIGKPEFSGLNDLLIKYRFNVISESNTSVKYPYSPWGLHDKDLFSEAEKYLLSKKNSNKPFALFLSTVSTHFPDGVYDSRMEDLIPKQDSDLEFMVASLDYHIGSLFKLLKEEGMLDNTVVYLLPDHLMMGNNQKFTGYTQKDRSLYLITNAENNVLSYPIAKDIYQIDIPKLILEGAQVKHNAKFLTDYIDSENNPQFLASNILHLVSLNEASLTTSTESGFKKGLLQELKDGFYSFKSKIQKSDQLTPKNSQIIINDTIGRFIAHAGGEIENIKYTNSLEALDNSYSKGFRLFELDIIETSDGKLVAAHDWEHWAAITKYEGDLPASSVDFLSHKLHGKFTPLDITTINNWFIEHPEAILVTDKINEPRKFAAQFVDKERLMMELFSLDAIKEGLAVGIRSAMPSDNVVSNLPGDRVELLKKMGVSHIAISRTAISKNISFLLQLKSAGIKTYVFHVNHIRGIDEEYVYDNELQYIYGMYADKWTFK